VVIQGGLVLIVDDAIVVTTIMSRFAHHAVQVGVDFVHSIGKAATTSGTINRGCQSYRKTLRKTLRKTFRNPLRHTEDTIIIQLKAVDFFRMFADFLKR
jgi:hypothetical protein